jgi:hypothetical protein
LLHGLGSEWKPLTLSDKSQKDGLISALNRSQQSRTYREITVLAIWKVKSGTIRSLAFKWIRIVFACWKTNKPVSGLRFNLEEKSDAPDDSNATVHSFLNGAGSFVYFSRRFGAEFNATDSNNTSYTLGPTPPTPLELRLELFGRAELPPTPPTPPNPDAADLRPVPAWDSPIRFESRDSKGPAGD